MSTNKIINPGFGIGAAFGVPITVGVAETSTLSLTSSLVGAYYMTGLATGTAFSLRSTTNGVTTSITIFAGASNGHVWLDGASGFIANTTTSISLVLVGT